MPPFYFALSSRTKLITRRRASATLLAAILALPLAAQTPSASTQPAGEVVVLDTLEITERQADSIASINAAKIRLAEVTGTTSVVNLADVQRGRASNAEDVLAFQPGVFAQATSGNEAAKISIRGSGLNTFYQGYSLGVKFLYDGLSITGAGGTQEDLLNIAAVNYTEILNGANAFAYAATSLGGAINFVTHTGHTAPGLYARTEFGSFGYQKHQLSYGGVSGNTDYYVSVLHNERDGFQDNTPNEGNDLIVNIGHKFNERIETRLIYRYRESWQKNGSALSLAEIKDDPSQNFTLSGRKKPGTHLVLSKTTYHFDEDSRIEFGLGWNHYPLHNGWLYSAQPQDWESDDINTSLRYLRDGDQIFGRTSKTTIAFNDSRLVHGNVTGWLGQDGTPQTRRSFTKYTGSRDTVVSVANDLEVADKLWLSTGLSFVDIVRHVRIPFSTVANPGGRPTEVDRQDQKILPRIGLRYQASPDIQLFGNVSNSIDAPVTWYYGSTGNPWVTDYLKPQKATTAEIGVRGKRGIFEGSLSLYRSWVDHELLLVRIDPDPTVPGIRFNAGPTIHQGIELGLSTTLWETEAGDKLAFRQAYTLNDFYYENDKDFGDNKLPGLPTHYYQAELLYQHAKGFYFGVNARYSSDYFVDFANSLKAPSHVIWGAKIGWQTPRWSVFADLRNITDKHYVTASTNTWNAGGLDQRRFLPGDSFNVTSGISFHF